MQTIPSLCATSTLVGVSVAGYALARKQSPPNDSSLNKRKLSLDFDRMMPSFRLPHNSSHPFFSGRPSSSERQYTAGPPSVEGRSSLRKARRKTLQDTAVSRLTESENEIAAVEQRDSLDAGNGARLTLRNRPSWMRRLSAMSSVESSPISSPRPDSPNDLARHISPAYSHSGSTAPIIGSSNPPPLPPNKLVKRSSSQRLTDRTNSGSKFPTLRRPATSHQRATTLHDFPYTLNGMAAQQREATREHRPYTPSDERWKQFFVVRISTSSSKGRKRGNAVDEVPPMKQILPEAGCIPHLISAETVLTHMIEVEQIDESEMDHSIRQSRPGSAYFGSRSFVRPQTNNRTTESTVGGDEQPREPRRSFSLHELLSVGPTRSNESSTTKSISRQSSRRSTRRIFSDPLAGLGISRSSIDLERPPKRRDFPGNSLHPGRSSSLSPAMDIDRDPPTPTDVFVKSPLNTCSTANSFGSISTDASPEIDQTASIFQGLNLGANRVVDDFAEPVKPTNFGYDSHSNRSLYADSAPSSRLLQPGQHKLQAFNQGPELRRARMGGHSGPLNSHFETIIDESPPRKMRETPSKVISQRPDREENAEDEDMDMVATPGRTIRSDKADDGSPVARRLKIRARSKSPLPSHLHLPSSPPDAPKPLSLGTLEYDDDLLPGEDQEARWSIFNGETSDPDDSSEEDWGAVEEVATPLAFHRTNPLLVATSAQISQPSSHSDIFKPNDPDHASQRDSKSDLKSSIFDWSEQATEKVSANRSPPRPRTVHGKKVMDGRGSRSAGRRIPTALHIRSQSVPVVPDVAGTRDTVMTNKFGTWGVGSKGVSEDWDDDFDFGEESDQSAEDREERRIDSGVAMHIPQLIRDQQVNVVNNIGLVREFGSLVEELKSLRGRALSNGWLEPPRADVWDKVDGMIDLADQEVEDQAMPHGLSPPSSPGFNSEAFDESAENSMVDLSNTLPSDLDPRPAQRRSLLQDITNFSSASITMTSSQPPSVNRNSITRPRADSEAVARSVIEALKQRKAEGQPLDLQPVPKNKKVPFDTNTLRHIVPYVNGLVREVKRMMREIEDLDFDEDQDTVRIASSRSRRIVTEPADPATPQDYPLRKLFQDPQDSPSARPKARATQSDTSVRSGTSESRPLSTNFTTLM